MTYQFMSLASNLQFGSKRGIFETENSFIGSSRKIAKIQVQENRQQHGVAKKPPHQIDTPFLA